MKKISLQFNKNNVLYIILFFFWIVFFSKLFIAQITSTKPLISFYCLNEGQKYEFIDGIFYRFMKFSKKFIPENSDILFDVLPKEPLEYSEQWYIKEYYMQKMPYYLFPRRIFTKNLAEKKKIDYSLVYNPESESFSLYHNKKLIIHANH